MEVGHETDSVKLDYTTFRLFTSLYLADHWNHISETTMFFPEPRQHGCFKSLLLFVNDHCSAAISLSFHPFTTIVL